jgi:hypothetical protein
VRQVRGQANVIEVVVYRLAVDDGTSAEVELHFARHFDGDELTTAHAIIISELAFRQ